MDSEFLLILLQLVFLPGIHDVSIPFYNPLLFFDMDIIGIYW